MKERLALNPAVDVQIVHDRGVHVFCRVCGCCRECMPRFQECWWEEPGEDSMVSVKGFHEWEDTGTQVL